MKICPLVRLIGFLSAGPKLVGSAKPILCILLWLGIDGLAKKLANLTSRVSIQVNSFRRFLAKTDAENAVTF